MSVTIFIDSALRDREQYPDPLNFYLTAEQILTWVDSTKEIKALPSHVSRSPLDFASTVQILNLNTPYPRPELFGDVLLATSIAAGNNITFSDPHGLVIGDIVWTSSSNGEFYGVPSNVPLYVVASTPTTIQISTFSGGPVIVLGQATTLSLGFVKYTAQVQAAFEGSKIILTTPLLFLKLKCKMYEGDSRNVRCLYGSHAEATHILERGGATQGPDGAPAWVSWYSKAEQTLRWKLNDVLVIGIETRDGKPLEVFKESQEDLMKEMNPFRQLLLSFIVTPFIRDATYSNHFIEPKES
jgi:hypothetical protein